MFESDGYMLYQRKKKTSSFNYVCIINISKLQHLTDDHNQPNKWAMKKMNDG